MIFEWGVMRNYYFYTQTGLKYCCYYLHKFLLLLFWPKFFFFLKGAWDYIRRAKKNFLESKL